MADHGTRGSGNGLLYGLIGALCVVVAGGGYYIDRHSQTPAARSEIADDMRTARGRSGRQDDRVPSLLAAARAAIARHDYGAADRALDEAERIDARDPAVIRTRNELLEAAARPSQPGSRNEPAGTVR